MFTDETWVELVNGKQRRRKVSRPKGSNPYGYAREKTKSEPRMVFWGAIAFGFKGPPWIWDKASATEKQEVDD